MSNSPITDVIFDFCGVLLDWQTRACLTGHFPQDTVDAICAPDDPHGSSAMRTAWTPARTSLTSTPTWCGEQGEDIAPIFAYYIEHYGDACRACCPAWKICCAT